MPMWRSSGQWDTIRSITWHFLKPSLQNSCGHTLLLLLDPFLLSTGHNMDMLTGLQVTSWSSDRRSLGPWDFKEQNIRISRRPPTSDCLWEKNASLLYCEETTQPHGETMSWMTSRGNIAANSQHSPADTWVSRPSDNSGIPADTEENENLTLLSPAQTVYSWAKSMISAFQVTKFWNRLLYSNRLLQRLPVLPTFCSHPEASAKFRPHFVGSWEESTGPEPPL
jgi:hypothetical protein